MRTLLPTIIFGTILTAGILTAAGNVFQSIRAESKGDEIVLEWTSSTENGLASYEIERRSSESTTYRRIGQLAPRGNGNTYRFVDNGAFFKSDAEKQFTYRVRAVGSFGGYYSPPVTVSHEAVSSVKRSWGMIKELFR